MYKIESMSEMNMTIQSSGQDTTFIDRVKSYVSEKKPRLVILTPCFGSICMTNYVASLLSTFNLFSQLEIPIKIEFCRNDSLVSRARNNLIAKAMSESVNTHFMFIDNDITWSPYDVLKLLICDKPLCGGAYPIKHFHWEKLTSPENVVAQWLQRKNNSELASRISDVDFIQHRMLRYNINPLSGVISVENNLTRVRHLATGFMMIQRGVIEKMQRAFPSTKYVDDVGFLNGDENHHAFALFDCGVEDGHYYSEDWLFCSRWGKMGGEIHLDVSIDLNHSGTQDFKGSFISSLV
jgi:hypothetical protein